MVTFVEKLKLKTHDLIKLLIGKGEDGKVYYAYIQMDEEGINKLDADMEAKRAGDYEEYGEVLEFGEGMPDQATRTRMEEEYGVDHRPFLEKYGKKKP